MSSRFYVSSGISLVELMIAVTLLSLISVAALQFVRTSESTMIGEQVLLDQQQRSEAVSSHIYKKFISRTLAETATEQTYLDPTMAEDLRDGTGVSLEPRCKLLSDADVATGTLQIRHDCMTRAGQSITEQMNGLISRGVTLTFGLENGVGRCSISTPSRSTVRLASQQSASMIRYVLLKARTRRVACRLAIRFCCRVLLRSTRLTQRHFTRR
ncbi:MAG: hypothetical protein EBT94_11905 [Alphaproteobacteria bacterium]|nr:hypothetical protein [Alphaproteobacteria bacterium]